MHIAKLTSFNKPSMRALILAIEADQGVLPQFYWPQDVLGAEMFSTEMMGVFEGDVLVGFVLYRDLFDVWEISLVASHPEYRRRGYMEALLVEVIAAKGQGRGLCLEVHEENVGAQKLYEKLGFREVRRRPRYYQDGATAIVYAVP